MAVRNEGRSEEGGGARGGERKVALVTGASGGIGEAFAELLARDGYALVLVARSDKELSRVAGMITARFDLPVGIVSLDLTERDAGDELQAELDRRGAVPDLVVNNAGFGLNGPAAELDRARQVAMVDLNVRTVTDLSLRFLGGMKARGRGGVINIASTAAFMPGPYMAVYYASKAYVLSFSQALADELKGSGVTVTTVCPGPTETGFQETAGMQEASLFKLFPVMSAQDVAELGYDGYKAGKRVVVTGTMNKISAVTAPLAPTGLSMRVVRALQGKRGPGRRGGAS